MIISTKIAPYHISWVFQIVVMAALSLNYVDIYIWWRGKFNTPLFDLFEKSALWWEEVGAIMLYGKKTRPYLANSDPFKDYICPSKITFCRALIATQSTCST